MSYNSRYKGSEVDALLDKVNNGIPLATTSENGGIKIGYTLNGKNYPIVLDEEGKAYVNVPWSDLDTKYEVATQTSNGLMSSVDKKKLDGLSNYTLPTTAAATLGGVKVGYTNNGKNYKIQVDASGNAFVNVPWTDTNTTYGEATTSTAGLMSAFDKTKINGLSNYSLPTSTASALGGIKVGYATSGKNYKVQLDGSGNAYVNVPWTDTNTTYSVATTSADGLMSKSDKSKLNGIATGANNYSLPKSTTTALGGVMIGYAANGKNYAVVLDASGKAYVNVPWTDTNTTYSVATTSADGLMSSGDKAKMDMFQSYTTATSVASINANYQKVKVTLSANGTLSMSATGASMNGRSVTAYILASGANRTVTIPTSGSYISMCGSSVTIPSGKWTELNMECIDGVWHIAKLEQE
jgi:hypothetical protein|nr:MAG TPA: Head fiber protein [Caudoviricetes sp.]